MTFLFKKIPLAPKPSFNHNKLLELFLGTVKAKDSKTVNKNMIIKITFKIIVKWLHLNDLSLWKYNKWESRNEKNTIPLAAATENNKGRF